MVSEAPNGTLEEVLLCKPNLSTPRPNSGAGITNPLWVPTHAMLASPVLPTIQLIF